MEDEDNDSFSEGINNIGMTARLGPPGQEPRRRRKIGRSDGEKKEAGREHVQGGLITLHDERNRGEREEGNTERNKQVGEDEREKEPHSRADEQDSTDPNTSWTLWFDSELIARFATAFPYYMRTIEPLCRSHQSHYKTNWSELWVDAFTHYEPPFQRRVVPQHTDKHFRVHGPYIHYRVHKDEAACYLRSRGHLPALALFPIGHTFDTKPVEPRVMIWKLLLTYPVSGVQIQYSKKAKGTRRMHTISRDLHEKVSLEQFLADGPRETSMIDTDQVVPCFRRSRIPSDDLYGIFAPETISASLRKEAEQVFLEENLFVFTSLDDIDSFLQEGTPEELEAKYQHLGRVAFVGFGVSGNRFHEKLYQHLVACVNLREVHSHSRRHQRWHDIQTSKPLICRDTFEILARHEGLEAMCLSIYGGAKLALRDVTFHIAAILSETGSSCKTYCNGDSITAGESDRQRESQWRASKIVE